MPESIKVDPAELRQAAEKIDNHASDFATAHQGAHWRASQASLGSGAAGAALPEMLDKWETDGTRFGEHFTRHAEGHRTAADRFLRADGGDAGSARS